jgi:hypothetical protein
MTGEAPGEEDDAVVVVVADIRLNSECWSVTGAEVDAVIVAELLTTIASLI